MLKRKQTPKRKWTSADKKALLDGVGVRSASFVQRKTGNRSQRALAMKLSRLTGGASLSRGAWSLREACAYLGCHPTTLKLIRDELCQQWGRLTTKGNYMITEEQLTALEDHIKAKKNATTGSADKSEETIRTNRADGPNRQPRKWLLPIRR